MKLFKNITLFVAAAAILTSCAKYEEGPSFSLLSKKARVAGEWQIDNVSYTSGDATVDFTDQTNESLGDDFVLEFEKDGVYRTENKKGGDDKGTWELGEDGDDIRIQSNEEGAEEESFRITRLKSKELWMKQTQENGDVIYIKYKSKD